MLGTDHARETVQGTHRKFRGLLADYSFELTFVYHQESGQWVGICEELGTSAFADTREQMRFELKEAVLLQLDEMGRISNGREYLVDNGVSIVPVERSGSVQATQLNLLSQTQFRIT